MIISFQRFSKKQFGKFHQGAKTLIGSTNFPVHGLQGDMICMNSSYEPQGFCEGGGGATPPPQR